MGGSADAKGGSANTMGGVAKPVGGFADPTAGSAHAQFPCEAKCIARRNSRPLHIQYRKCRTSTDIFNAPAWGNLVRNGVVGHNAYTERTYRIQLTRTESVQKKRGVDPPVKYRDMVVDCQRPNTIKQPKRTSRNEVYRKYIGVACCVIFDRLFRGAESALGIVRASAPGLPQPTCCRRTPKLGASVGDARARRPTWWCAVAGQTLCAYACSTGQSLADAPPTRNGQVPSRRRSRPTSPLPPGGSSSSAGEYRPQAQTRRRPEPPASTDVPSTAGPRGVERQYVALYWWIIFDIGKVERLRNLT